MDSKGLLLALVGKPKKGKDEEAEDEMGSRELAAQGVIDAIKDEDPAMLAEAMKTMVDACKSCSCGGGHDYEDD